MLLDGKNVTRDCLGMTIVVLDGKKVTIECFGRPSIVSDGKNVPMECFWEYSWIKWDAYETVGSMDFYNFKLMITRVVRVFVLLTKRGEWFE